MMMKTHLIVALAVSLMLLPFMVNKIIFIPIVLIATLIPDIDISRSHFGSKWYFRPVQWFVKHRGIIHSLTLCLVVSFLFAIYLPVLAFPFFLGYSLHLIGDSLTIEGVRPFWPYKMEVEGNIRTGGKIEEGIFFGAAILSIILIVGLLF